MDLADTFGNHNFDRNLTHLARMMDLAESRVGVGRPFHYVVSNLKGYSKALPRVRPFRVFRVGPIKVGVVGIISPEAPTMVTQGAFGPITIAEPVAAAQAAQRAARKAGADIVICLVHMGVEGWRSARVPRGRLIDFANATRGFDLILGDHTNQQWTGVLQNQTVVENLSHAHGFARTLLTVQRRPGRAAHVTANVEFVRVATKGGAVDADMARLVADYHKKLRPRMSVVLAHSPVQLVVDGSTRVAEAPIGNTMADCVRGTYKADVAVLVAGGIRETLTCVPGAGGGKGFCPTPVSATPPFPITQGSLIAVRCLRTLWLLLMMFSLLLLTLRAGISF